MTPFAPPMDHRLLSYYEAIERGAQPLLDDARSTADRTPLGLDLAGAHRPAGLREGLQAAVEQQRDEAVRVGTADGGLHTDLVVRGGESMGSCRAGGELRAEHGGRAAVSWQMACYRPCPCRA